MINRWIGILLIGCMLSANTALFIHDVVPVLYTSEPPPNDGDLLKKDHQRLVQVGIFDADGRNVGRSWTKAECTSDEAVSVSTWTVLQLTLRNGVATPRVRIESVINYRPGEGIKSVSFSIVGLPIDVRMEAEAYGSGDFPVRWKIGDFTGDLVLNSDVPRALGDAIRPFDRLPELSPGRTWRVRVVNPTFVLYGSDATPEKMIDSVWVRVTGAETITHDGERVDTYVVEMDGGGAKAWVARDGRVLRQEVRLPFVGVLTLLDEEVDRDMLQAVSKGRLDVIDLPPGGAQE